MLHIKQTAAIAHSLETLFGREKFLAICQWYVARWQRTQDHKKNQIEFSFGD